MNCELVKRELLKHARNAFEKASTINQNQRIEVYLDSDKAKISDTLEESEEIVYADEKKLCYQIYGYNYLEDEIKAWIDYARVLEQPADEVKPQEPSDIELSIRELINKIAKERYIKNEDVSSNEVFANLPANLLGAIEEQIFEYWWSANEEENGKKLALKQIDNALNL